MEGFPKIALTGDVVLCVHRLVKTDDRDGVDFEESFYSNKRKGKPARGVEQRCPPIWDSLSMYTSAEGARDQYERIAAIATKRGRQPQIGSFVARLCLPGDRGFAYRDTRSPTGHVSVWGEPLDLIAHVMDIFPA